MFQNFSYFLAILIVAATLHHVLPSYMPRLRQISAFFFSCLLIMIISPIALLFTAVVFVITYGYTAFFRHVSQHKGYGYAFSALIICACLFAKYRAPTLGAVEVVGISYVMLKALSVVWMTQWRNYRLETVSAWDILLLLFFFPIFSAGPIERPKVFLAEAFSKRFAADDIGFGIYRILLGIFKLHFLAANVLTPLIVQLGPVANLSTPMTWVYVWSKFLVLYIGFSGYTDLAVGSSRLFGLKIVENFNFPLISGSIREFWTRWHMSLGRFVSTFIFFPVVKMLRGRVEIAIFLSFIIVGLWHNLSWTYLIWGIGHGGSLAFYFVYDRYMKNHERLNAVRLNNWGWQAIAILVTFSYISLLSVFANSGGWSAGVEVLKKAAFLA